MPFSDYNKTYRDQYIEADLATQKDNFKRSFAQKDADWIQSGTLAAHVDGLKDTLASIGNSFPAEWQGDAKNAAVGYIWRVVAHSNSFDVERSLLLSELGRKRRAMFSAITATAW